MEKDYAWLEGWWRVPESAFKLAEQHEAQT